MKLNSQLSTHDRAYGALLGLAAGDSIGSAALVHRMIRLPGQRAMLWRQAAEMDEQHVLRTPQPYTIGRPEPLSLSGTDDTEYAAMVASILVANGGDTSISALEEGWRSWLIDTDDEVWGGVAESAARINVLKGLHAPASGNDNPHHFDDSSVARSVPLGIHHHGSPELAAEAAGRLASISHSEDGIWAAQGMAAAIAVLVDGGTLGASVAVARTYIPAGSWLSHCTEQAFTELEQAGSAFAAVPGWHDRVANASYSYGTIAPETFAVALAIASTEPRSLEQALGLAALIPKQSDSMPAMVGALVGAATGAAAIPSQWVASLDRLRGHAIPATNDLSLLSVVDSLLG